MQKTLIFTIGIVILLFVQSCHTGKGKTDAPPVVIMLSMDGFRWDYPDLYSTPNLDAIARKGVKAHSLVPSFPSKTFPNHYTMATGLYPDNHGLVSNSFIDPVRKDMYRLGDRTKVEDAYYYGGYPIWVTAEKNGITAASFYWVGSEAPIQGIHPTIWKKFDSSVAFEARIDSVVSWTRLPDDKRPRLITWYMEEPDLTGHDFGPFHEETGRMVQYLDSLVGLFMEKIARMPGNENVNIIITSDHGMGEIHGDKYIDIDRDLKEEWIDYILGSNPVLFVEPAEAYADSVLNNLKKIPHLQAWKKEDMPEHLHFGSNPRISDLVVLADSGWSIGTNDSVKFTTAGTHGYDPSNSDMHAIFYAVGPAFKSGHSHPSFYNVDLYLLITSILGIEPAPNDGNFQRITGMLSED